MKLTFDKEVKQVERFLLKQWSIIHPPKHGRKREVNIYCWGQAPDDPLGIRVAEVSFTETRRSSVAGSSFMQCDTESVPFLCERLILELAVFKEDVEQYKSRLALAAFGKGKQ